TRTVVSCKQICKPAVGNPYASYNAYNPCALASVDGTGVAANGGWACDTVILHPVPPNPTCPEAVTFAGIPAVFVGALLLAAAFVLVCIALARRPTPQALLVGVTI